MKAFLMAAGTGSRLRPLTDVTPKCLLRVDGTTLLDRWLDAFAKSGVDEVLVNLHHLPDEVRAHLELRAGMPVVHLVYEPELLGSAGTLVAHRRWIQDEEMFLVCNADNLTDFDLQILIDAHRASTEAATLAVFHASDPTACGIVTVDRSGRITQFVEKPSHPNGDLANAGIYAFHPSVLDKIAGTGARDIGYDLLPRLVGTARAVPISGYFRDIGTPEAFEQAQREWKAAARR
jgi:mannose-1-phosphate guanylyltransferase